MFAQLHIYSLCRYPKTGEPQRVRGIYPTEAGYLIFLTGSEKSLGMHLEKKIIMCYHYKALHKLLGHAKVKTTLNRSVDVTSIPLIRLFGSLK